MQCYTQLVPPTAVNACASLPFTSATANNLVVAKFSLLQIFSLKAVLTDVDVAPTDGSNPRRERVHTSKLVLVAQYELPGAILALQRVKTKSKSEGDLLLVALKDAKLSLLGWDPERNAISTLSIHYYERDDVISALWDGDLGHHRAILTVDPGSRCAAFKFGARHFAILPFRQAGYELGMDEVEGGGAAVDSHRKTSFQTNSNEVAESAAKNAPTAKSSVLSLLSLDPSLIHPIDVAFMHGYRDPTLAILSSTLAPSQNLLSERRDILSLTVYTLDIEQRASTTLLSVTGLPYDLYQIVPLPAPVGGILLVGSNEIIHVDQSGKTNGLAVNDIATKTSSFAMVQPDGLNLRLEDAVFETTGSSGDVLVILRDGELYTLTLQVDGRSVSGLSMQKAQTYNEEPILTAPASCAANVGRGRCFIGSADGDSVVIGYSSASGKIPRRQSTQIMTNGNEANDTAEHDEAEDDEEDDEDDLYATAKTPAAATSVESPTTGRQDYIFRVHDRLLNLAPLRTPLLSEPKEGTEGRRELYASGGSSIKSSLIRLTPFVTPSNVQDTTLTDVDGVWPVLIKEETSDTPQYHNVLLTSKVSLDGGESHIYKIGENDSMAEIEESEFTSEGATIDATTFKNNTRLVQVMDTQVRVFEHDFSLSEIVPLFEEEDLDRMPKILSASFAEPYILLLRDDARITILKVDDEGGLEEMELPDNLAETRWMSGCLYDDPKDALQLDPEDNQEEEPSSVLAFLLTENGGLQVYQLPNTTTPVYDAPGLSFVPPYLSSDFNLRRSGKDREEIVELLVTELGDAVAKSPYLILRSNVNDITLYQPFQNKSSGAHPLRFMKIPHTFLPKATSDDEEEEEGMGQNRQRMQPMKVIADLHGFSSVVMPGASSSLILKAAVSHPQVFDLQTENSRRIIGFNTPGCPSGLIFATELGTVASAQLPASADFSTGWLVDRPIQLNMCIDAFTQHKRSKRLVLGTSRYIPYKLPHDDLHPEWDGEVITFQPEIEQGSLRLVSPETWEIEDAYEFAVGEVVMSMQAHSLEVSEITHQRRDMVVVGTATAQGEDMPVQGKVYVFDVVEVVRDPEGPGPAVRLKLIALEEFRGGVTALSPVGTEGLLLVAQGQKCMVRGLTEENNFLPAAAIDVQCFVSQLRELPGSGMFLIADAIKGVWFAGYNESPYNIRLFGRAKEDIQVQAADFMPDQDRLYVVLADSEGILHTLQFDPHNPRSLAGQRLLPLSTFRAGSHISHLTLLPRQPATYEALAALTPGAMDIDSGFATHQLLATGQDGSISLVTPLSTRAYSTLTALQNYMGQTLQHPLGLNPRAWRAADADRTIGGCLPTDGNVLKQWMNLGSWKRVDGLRKTGLDQDWELRMVLEGVGVRGLGYL